MQPVPHLPDAAWAPAYTCRSQVHMSPCALNFVCVHVDPYDTGDLLGVLWVQVLGIPLCFCFWPVCLECLSVYLCGCELCVPPNPRVSCVPREGL